MKNKLPDFRPVTRDEMRDIWTRCPDPDVRRLALEIERYRRVMGEIDSLYHSIQQAWKDAVGGDLVALHRFKLLMLEERERAKL